MSEHTKGPWAYDMASTKPRGWNVEDGTGYLVAIVPNQSGRPCNEFNARLIAAAPELLKALQKVMEWADPIAGDNQDEAAGTAELQSVGMARAVIAKATGVTP